MRASRLAPLFLALLLLCAGTLSAQQARPTLPTMPVSEIKPGMKGYGLTVFQGIGVERFDVTVRGVIRNAFADGDMIIIEAEHPELENLGVVAGMSGSPVFIDDRIIGAVAYGWGFSIHAICGVTPIESMYDVFELVTDESLVPSEESAVSTLHWPEARAALGGGNFNAPPPLMLPPAELATMGLGSLAAEGAMVLEPLSSPLMVGTRSPLVMEHVQELFSGSLFHPVMAGVQGSTLGSGSDDPALADAMPENGSAFSVILADGDLQLAGLGTATVVEGDRLIGFGHPMMGLGAVDMPMALSEVIAIVPSRMRPFKLGNAVKEVGALRQDRLPAVGGTFSQRTAMVPMTINVEAPETETTRAFNFRLWNERSFLPQLAMICFLESMDRSARLDGPMNMAVEYRIALANGRELVKEDFLSGDSFVTMMGGMYLMRGLSVLMNNRFEPAAIDNIEMNVTMQPRIQIRVLDELNQGRTTFRAGETWRGEVKFNQWRTGPDRIAVEVPLPRDLRPGTYEIHLADGATRMNLELAFRPELMKVESLDDLLELNRPSFPNDALYVLLVDPQEQLVLGGQKLPNMPRSVAELTRTTNVVPGSVGASGARLVSETRIPLPSMVAGSSITRITIEKE